MSKFIFVAGGVMSGIGKGISVASIGALLQSRGFRVTAIKIDPYINVDAGTMNPVEHGEVFVTADGVECDQDIGNYERFLNVNLSRLNYMTTGSVYLSVIQRERALKYNGKSVEAVPHIPEEVIRRVERAGKETRADFVLIEIGGTVGEYQNILFLEAARMMLLRNVKNTTFVFVTYLPILKALGEMKTKPAQTSVRLLNSVGIQPNIIIARSETRPDEPRKQKIATFCNIDKKSIISAPDVTSSIYEAPIQFEKERIVQAIIRQFNMRDRKANLGSWRSLIKDIKKDSPEVKIGIVGKYFDSGEFILEDSYISVIEAIKHAVWSLKSQPAIETFSAERYEKNPEHLSELKKYHGIVIPGGFGSRGVLGKIKVIKYCRENKIPYFGLCYGMQLAVIEMARSLAGLKDANSSEIDPKTKHPVIDIMESQKKNLSEKQYGGSMRLGDYECELKPKTLASKIYKQRTIFERHRHRYEVNSAYIEKLESAGNIVFSGINPKTKLVEILELNDHPFFLGTQFHPEFLSRPMRPHPLFRAFIGAAKQQNLRY